MIICQSKRPLSREGLPPVAVALGIGLRIVVSDIRHWGRQRPRRAGQKSSISNTHTIVQQAYCHELLDPRHAMDQVAEPFVCCHAIKLRNGSNDPNSVDDKPSLSKQEYNVLQSRAVSRWEVEDTRLLARARKLHWTRQRKLRALPCFHELNLSMVCNKERHHMLGIPQN